jgi:acyl-CoA synthetase (AMP-forming)/AMP-acid ligase II
VSAAGELHWATVWEAIADAVPDQGAVVQGERRTSWRAFDDRAARLAAAFSEAGLRPGSKVAQFLYNAPEYAESFFAAIKVRAVPVNVNYRYLEDELLYLLENSDAEALLFHSSLADRVAAVRGRATNLKLLVEVDDGAAGSVDGAHEYESLLRAHAPAARMARDPGDTFMLYTGGTTGMPKGVMSRIGPGVTSLLAAVAPLLGQPSPDGPEGAAALAARLAAEDSRLVSLSACPLMHGTGLVIGMQTGLAVGGTMCLLASRSFDADELWDVVEREGVGLVAIVGDPFARPMLRALEARVGAGRAGDLGRLRFVSSSGAMFSNEVKEGLLRLVPQLTILDYISSTEGRMGVSIATAGAVLPTGRFLPVPGVKVFTEDGREVAPGSGERGLVGLSVGVPDAYYKDAAKSAATFREVGGMRYSFPGDWALVEADEMITLLGRGSQCINTGGEKVFPEEVEEALKRHPAVDDALVFGIPDERFGQRIVAVASGRGVEAGEVLVEARAHLAAYKVPRDLAFVDVVPRTPSGKADYGAARELFLASRAGPV